MRITSKRIRGAKPQRETPTGIPDNIIEAGKAAIVLSDLTRPGGSRQTSPKLSTLAAKVLQGYEPTTEEIRSMAASLLAQDETKGQHERKKK